MTNKTWISDIWDETKGKPGLESIYIEKRLNEIILPGTDNSGSTKFINEQDNDEHKFFPFGFTTFINYNKLYKSKWHITQIDSITALLEKGIRYFHFRISWFDNEWFISNKYKHIKLNEILKEFKTYLKWVTDNNKSEFVYLDFELDPNHYFTKNSNTSPSNEEIEKFYEILKNDETLNAYIYKPESAEIGNGKSWHNNWQVEGNPNEYNRTQDGTKTIYDHLLRRKALVDKQVDGYTRGIIKLPTLDKVFKKAVIFVDEVLYKFENGTNDEKVNYNLIKPFPSFLLKNNSLDMNLVIDETPYQIHNANQQWLYHTKNKTNLIPLKYGNKNYKFIDSMFNKLQLSHSISDRFYETNPNTVCNDLKTNKIQHGRRSHWDDRKICKRQSFATRTSINMIYLKAIIKILLWAIPILQILSFFNPVGGPYWGLYITIYERDPKFYIIIVALVFFVIVTFISNLYKYFVECIPNLDQEDNEEIASNLIGKFDELSTRFPWNIKQISIISVNYPTDDIINKIINLNQREEREEFNDPLGTAGNKNKLIYSIETNDITETELNPDKLKIKLWNVRSKDENDVWGSFIGKLKFNIFNEGTGPVSENFTRLLVDQDNLIINNNTAKLEEIDGMDDTYTYTHTISLHRLVNGVFKLTLWIEDEYGVNMGEITTEYEWNNGIEDTNQVLKIVKKQEVDNQKWTEPFKNITQIPSNSSQRLKQFYESRLF